MKYTKSQQLSAGQRLKSRAQCFSNIDATQQQEAKSIRNMLPRLSLGLQDDDMGTNAPILWKANFEFIKAIQVHAKSLANQKKYIANLYKNIREIEPTKHDYALFTYGRSAAKICFDLHPSADSLTICSMNNHQSDFRCGTFLIQLAVELSLTNGYEGRIYLNSARQSGQFYFKLGFLPEHPEIYNELMNDKKIDGGPMFLPKPAISAWKKIIKKNAILPETLEYLSKHEKSIQIQDKQTKKIPLNLILSKFNKEHLSRLAKISGALGLLSSVAILSFLPLTAAIGIGCCAGFGAGIIGLVRIHYFHSLITSRMNNKQAGNKKQLTPKEQIAYDLGQKAISWPGYFSICCDRNAWRYSKASYSGLIDAQKDRCLSEINEEIKASSPR